GRRRRVAADQEGRASVRTAPGGVSFPCDDRRSGCVHAGTLQGHALRQPPAPLPHPPTLRPFSAKSPSRSALLLWCLAGLVPGSSGRLTPAGAAPPGATRFVRSRFG